MQKNSNVEMASCRIIARGSWFKWLVMCLMGVVLSTAPLMAQNYTVSADDIDADSNLIVRQDTVYAIRMLNDTMMLLNKDTLIVRTMQAPDTSAGYYDWWRLRRNDDGDYYTIKNNRMVWIRTRDNSKLSYVVNKVNSTEDQWYEVVMGIDTTAPDGVVTHPQLEAKGYMTDQLWQQNGDDIYYDDGKVGIGTETPFRKIDIRGKAVLGNSVTANKIEIGSWPVGGRSFSIIDSTGSIRIWRTGGANYDPVIEFITNVGDEVYNINNVDSIRRWDIGSGSIDSGSVNPAFFIRDRSSSVIENRLTIDSDGKVGIGTTIPKEILDINGNITGDTIIETVVPWSLIIDAPVFLTSYTETDPTVPNYVKEITVDEILNWKTAYTWGDHAAAGYLTSYTETDPVYLAAPAAGITSTNITNWNTAFGWGDHATAGYLTSYSETDPIYSAAPAAGITSTNITNWNTAFGWGDHATAGYLTSYSETDPIYSAAPSAGITSTNITNWNTAFGWGDHATAGYLTSYTETDPVYLAAPAAGITSTNITNWNTAFGWGDHATAGYLTSYSETDPIYSAAPSAGITSTNITNWNTAFGWGDHATAGYLTSYTETDPVYLAAPAAGITSTDITTWNNCDTWIDVMVNTYGLNPEAIGNWNTAYGWGNHASVGYLTSYTETDPIFISTPAYGIIASDITNWNTAYGWGDHATAGYLTSYTETDPVFLAAPAAGITSTNITNWNTAYGWGDHATAGYLSDETDPFFDTKFTAKTTDDLTEGNTNKYTQWCLNGTDLSYVSGQIGVGTTSPSYKIDIQDNTVNSQQANMRILGKADGTLSKAAARFDMKNNSTNDNSIMQIRNGYSGVSDLVWSVYSGDASVFREFLKMDITNGDIVFGANNVEKIYFNNNGLTKFNGKLQAEDTIQSNIVTSYSNNTTLTLSGNGTGNVKVDDTFHTNGAIIRTGVRKSADYTIGADDYYVELTEDATTDKTFTLPTSPDTWRELAIKNNNDTYTLTISGSFTESSTGWDCPPGSGGIIIYNGKYWSVMAHTH